MATKAQLKGTQDPQGNPTIDFEGTTRQATDQARVQANALGGECWVYENGAKPGLFKLMSFLARPTKDAAYVKAPPGHQLVDVVMCDREQPEEGVIVAASGTRYTPVRGSVRQSPYGLLGKGAKPATTRPPFDGIAHASDCATHNAPAGEPGTCDCHPIDSGKPTGGLSYTVSKGDSWPLNGSEKKQAAQAAADFLAAEGKEFTTRNPGFMGIDWSRVTVWSFTKGMTYGIFVTLYAFFATIVGFLWAFIKARVNPKTWIEAVETLAIVVLIATIWYGAANSGHGLVTPPEPAFHCPAHYTCMETKS